MSFVKQRNGESESLAKGEQELLTINLLAYCLTFWISELTMWLSLYIKWIETHDAYFVCILKQLLNWI